MYDRVAVWLCRGDAAGGAAVSGSLERAQLLVLPKLTEFVARSSTKTSANTMVRESTVPTSVVSASDCLVPSSTSFSYAFHPCRMMSASLRRFGCLQALKGCRVLPNRTTHDRKGLISSVARPSTKVRLPAAATVLNALYEAVQVITAAVLAAAPWVLAFSLIETTPTYRLIWVGAVGVQALCLVVRPAQRRVIGLLSVVLLGGLCFIQATVVYSNIVTSALQQDYFLIASWLSVTSQSFLAVPVTLPQRLQLSYVQYYFDPLVPILNRVFQLTHDPFRLLGFQLVALVSAPLTAWFIATRHDAMRPFQVLLPAALMIHPSFSYTLQADYHTSGIGITFFLLGTYLFWTHTHQSAFIVLLIGTLTKVSYWPSWLMFAVLHGTMRRWRWMLLYGLVGIVALLIYRLIQPASGAGNPLANLALDKLSPAAIISVLLDPGQWSKAVIEPPLIWLWFFFLLFLPFGFTVFRRPIVLTPLVPLVGLSILDQFGWRTLIFNVYAIEYLGFSVAAVLLGLRVSGRRMRALMAVAMTLGLLVGVANPYRWMDWNPVDPQAKSLFDRERALAEQYRLGGWRSSWPTIPAMTGEYTRAAAFSECTIGDAPVIVTSYFWASYVRGRWDQVWVEEGNRQLDASVWERTETLVYPANPRAMGSLSYFPFATEEPNRAITTGFDRSRYGSLILSLPVTVTTKESMFEWRYLGGQRLADCAARYGYAVERTVTGEHWLDR